MANIELINVEKRFDEFHAVKPMNLTINDGEFVVLLGPSGCGKTTTLRMISGLEAVTGGQILLNGRDVTWAHPSERDIAFVFQFFALYSHMTVQENIAFPLQAQHEPRNVVQQRVAEVAELLQIGHLLRLRPGVLSGGDQQRVALARALVRRPAAFLMDEPLGALDAEFRETMRAEIKRLHIEQHATSVYVTHDQIEAMAMGDRIVVMSAAEVQQIGTPAEVYHDPSNLFVARFIGSPGMNLIDCEYHNGKITIPGCGDITVTEDWTPALNAATNGSGALILGFRPEAASVMPDGALPASVYANDLHGGYTMLHLDIGQDRIVHTRSGRETHYNINAAVTFDLDPAMIRFFDPATENAIRKEMKA